MNGLIVQSRYLKHFIPKCVQISQFATGPSSPVYELRTYGVHPKDFKSFLDLSSVWLDLRCSHSKLIGYWISEIGGISDVCHIWEYEDLNHRARVRKALAEDKAWMTEYLNKILPMMRYQDNSLLTVAQDCSLITQVKPGGVYEIQALTKTSDTVTSSISGDSNSSLLGRFFSIIGPTNSEFRLWHHTSMDAALDFLKRNSNDIKTVGHSRLLVPAPWSPLK